MTSISLALNVQNRSMYLRLLLKTIQARGVSLRVYQESLLDRPNYLFGALLHLRTVSMIVIT